MQRLLSALSLLVALSSWQALLVHAQDACASLKPGDVMMYAFNSDDPESINMVAFAELPSGLELFVTDNAWTGTDFLTNEGTFKLTLTSAVQPGGSLGYGQNAGDVPFATDWVNVEDDNPKGQFALADTGDSMLVYCKTSVGGIKHLAALSFTTGGFAEPGLDPEDYGTRNSALPAPLLDVGSVALRHLDNFIYIGPLTGNTTELQTWLSDKLKWEGSYNPDAGAPPVLDFNILKEGSAADLETADNGGGGAAAGSSGGGQTSVAVSMAFTTAVALRGALLAVFIVM